MEPPGALHNFPAGARLKALREVRGLSQRELARRAHITNANLSMIEQNKVSPALSTLEKILQALNIEIAEFFSSPEPSGPIFKTEDFTIIRRKGGEFSLMPSLTVEPPASYLAKASVSPGARLEGVWLSGVGTISGVVQAGKMLLGIGATEYPIVEGEGFEFCLSRKHYFMNPTDQPCIFWLSILCKP